MDIKAIGGLVGLLITIASVGIGSTLYLEDRFIQKAHAEERHADLYKELQKRDIQTKIDLIELELEFLDPEDDAKELAQLERKRDLLEKHLLELQDVE